MLVSFVWIRNTFLSTRNKSGTFSERPLAFLWQPKAAELTLSVVDTILALNIISSQWEKGDNYYLDKEEISFSPRLGCF